MDVSRFDCLLAFVANTKCNTRRCDFVVLVLGLDYLQSSRPAPNYDDAGQDMGESRGQANCIVYFIHTRLIGTSLTLELYYYARQLLCSSLREYPVVGIRRHSQTPSLFQDIDHLPGTPDSFFIVRCGYRLDCLLLLLLLLLLLRRPRRTAGSKHR